MAWWAWGITTLLGLNALFLTAITFWTWWERHMDRAHSRSFDKSFCAEHKIDFSRTTQATFLGRRR